jgi:RES domain-containing protein
MTRLVRVWRVAKAKHEDSAFEGLGAKRAGGRWNSAGTRVVYCSSTLSLATLELLVHLKRASALAAYVAFAVDIPEDRIRELEERLAKGWDGYPYLAATQELGDRWAEGRLSLALRVPSAILPSESNFLINPLHPDRHQLKIGKPETLRIDRRLVSKGA